MRIPDLAKSLFASELIASHEPTDRLSRRGLLTALGEVVVGGAIVGGLSVQMLRGEPAEKSADKPAEHPFLNLKNVKVTVTDEHFVVESDGIPNHKTAKYPNRDNPNRILKQKYKFKIPRHPQRAAETTPLPMGPIGVAINGIPFYNPYNRERRDAVTGPFAEVFDSCCGHPDPMGRYHYHKYPVCVKSPFQNSEGEHSPLIGIAFDGFGVYGPNDSNGKPPSDLDDCNGHEDETRGYHYHVTEKFPYILGAYRGVVEMANFDGPRGGRPGGPGAGHPGGPGGGPPRGPGMGPPGGPGGGPPGGPGRNGPPRKSQRPL